MTKAGIAAAVGEGFAVVRDLALGRFPPFVTGGDLPRGQVPVFVFHGLEPHSFERKLAHLDRNGYRTLSADEYLEVLSGDRIAPERAVALTFDDGNGSLWSVGLPFLKRYGMKAVVFLVPGRIESHPHPLPPTWEDVRDGRADPASVLGRDRGDRPFLSWEEIEAMNASGLVDFESHTYLHARIHTSPILVDFVSPGTRRGPPAMDVPLIRQGDQDLLAHQAPLGTPLYASAPRTSEALRFFENPKARGRCIDRVAEAGGDRFFARADWRRELRRVHGKRSVDGVLETKKERDIAIESELVKSKRAIEDRTGRKVSHLCFPWHVAGPTARQSALDVGYRAAFCGKVKGTPITPIGGDPWAIARIGEDYLELLPGKGRTSLASVLGSKWSRRLDTTLRTGRG